MTITVRDNQLYDIELEVLGYGGFFTDLADAQAYVDDITKSQWWRSRSKVRHIELTYAVVKRDCLAVFDPSKPKEGWIDLARGRLCEQFILHELAHLMAWPKDGEEQHYDRFVAAELQLIRRYYPRMIYKRFYDALRDGGFTCPTR